MTEPTPETTEDASRREQAKAQLGEAVEGLKAELATRLDQFLDEVGALI
jgi:hypothetical protein